MGDGHYFQQHRADNDIKYVKVIQNLVRGGDDGGDGDHYHHD